MPTITVRNIPPEFYEKLKKTAEANHRSISSEIIACIERTFGSREIDPEALIADARKLRAKTANHPITNRVFSRAKAKGRP